MDAQRKVNKGSIKKKKVRACPPKKVVNFNYADAQNVQKNGEENDQLKHNTKMNSYWSLSESSSGQAQLRIACIPQYTEVICKLKPNQLHFNHDHHFIY